MLRSVLSIAAVASLLALLPSSSFAQTRSSSSAAAKAASGVVVNIIPRRRPSSMRFTAAGTSYAYAEYVDGNGNGVLTREIRSGVDPLLRPQERLADQFTGESKTATEMA